jgi:4,5-dihydroxyphthalate decarboxylase
LFPDFKAVEQDYYRRTGIFPIMHTIVVREDIHKAHPWVASRIFKAFCKAKDLAIGGLYDTDALHLTLPWLIDYVEETWRVFGKDYWPYGLQPNRPAIDAVGRYVHEQGLAPRSIASGEMFLDLHEDPDN